MKTKDQWLAEMPTGRLGLTEWIAAIQKEAFEEGFFKSSIALKLSWEALNGYPCYCASGERQHTCKRCLALMAIEWCLSRPEMTKQEQTEPPGYERDGEGKLTPTRNCE